MYSELNGSIRQNGAKQGDAISPFFFSFTYEHAIKKSKKTRRD
jgi:hypothetical protein